MFFQSATNSYVCPMLDTRRRKPLINIEQLMSLLNEKLFMQMITRAIVILLLVVLVARFWMGAVADNIDESILVHEQQSHVLVDENIALRAQKAFLLSPQRIERLAAEKLALYVPSDSQVRYVN